MTVFDYIEDFDNPDLSSVEWLDQLYDAVRDYNDEFGTLHDPQTIVAQYCSMQREKKWHGMDFKYEIGDHVWQYTKEDEYERAVIIERTVINDHKCYITDIVPFWTNEDFLL